MGLALAALAQASVTAPEKPLALGSPTVDYATVVKELNEATFVVIYYLDGTKAVVSDPEWMNLLKSLLTAAEGKPDDLCFCSNYPKVVFVNHTGNIARMEVAHGIKLRISRRHDAGDFIVGKKIGTLVSELLMVPYDRGFKSPKAPSAPQSK